MRNAKLALLRLAKLSGGFRVARWLTANRLKILCYHGFEIGDEAGFRPKLFISKAAFEQRLASIRRLGFRVLPLAEAVDRLYRGTLPRNSIVITVDDGFHSFHRIALPLLEQYGFPATVYATTYYVQHAHPIFRLVVQYMFWRAQKRDIRFRNLRWMPDGDVDLGNAREAERAMSSCIEFGEQHCNETERVAIVEELGALLGVPYAAIAASKSLSLMSPEELASLADRGVDVQLHTHRHAFSSVDRASAEREIEDNRKALRNWLPGEATHFCYPSGMWIPAQWDWLEALGVRSATTCDPGLNSDATPPHALRRFLDGENIHPLEFESALCGFSDLVRSLRRRPTVSRPRLRTT
jgi:peptidoglycan/xylan/chitin deacetylase (PgdA/CDA1 family)